MVLDLISVRLGAIQLFPTSSLRPQTVNVLNTCVLCKSDIIPLLFFQICRGKIYLSTELLTGVIHHCHHTLLTYVHGVCQSLGVLNRGNAALAHEHKDMHVPEIHYHLPPYE